jgi:hypothetical protein
MARACSDPAASPDHDGIGGSSRTAPLITIGFADAQSILLRMDLDP